MENGPITIVVFGYSITHGAFGPGEIDYEAVYWNILKKRLNEVRNYVPLSLNIRQRQREGIIAAQKRGVKFGRPPIKTPDNFEENYLL